MIHLRVTILLLIAMALSSCATSRRDPLTARKEAYERLASFLEPGMTRRQVYALLPPQRTPVTTEAGPFGLILGRGPTASRLQNELHPLDPDFDLSVYYILAKPKGRVSIPAHNARPMTLAGRSGPLAISAHAIDVHYTGPRRTPSADPMGSRAISANGIDDLLLGRKAAIWTPKIVPSKEDMNDRLSSRPTVTRALPSLAELIKPRN